MSRKIPARLHDTGGLRESFADSLPAEVIDRIGADGGIESGRLERKFAHVGGFDSGALVHARRFQICEQSLLRTFAGPEVLVKRAAEQIERDQSRARTGFEHHDRRSAGTRPYVEHSPHAGNAENFGSAMEVVH
jgi:hypothetical protein